MPFLNSSYFNFVLSGKYKKSINFQGNDTDVIFTVFKSYLTGIYFESIL